MMIFWIDLKTKGYAVVEFANSVELRSVVKHGKEQLLNGRRLRISEFNKQDLDKENDESIKNGSENEQRDSEIGEARENVQVRQHSTDEDDQELPQQQAIKKKSQSLKAYVSAVVDKKKTLNKQGSGDYQAVQGKQRFQGISKDTKTKEQQQQQQFYQQFSSSDAELLTEVQHNWRKLNRGLDQLQNSISKLQAVSKDDQLIKDKELLINQLQKELSSEKNDKHKLLNLNSEMQFDMISLTAEKTALAKSMTEEIGLKEEIIQSERNTHMMNMQVSSQQILSLSQQIEELQRRIAESQVNLQEKEKQMQWQQPQQVNLNNQVIGNQQGSSQIADLEKQLSEQRMKAEKAQIHLSTVTQELTLSKQELNKVTAEVNSLKAKLQQMTEELAGKTANLSQQTAENKTLKGQLENLNKEITVLKINIEKLSAECQAKGEKIISCQRQLKENEVLEKDRINKVIEEKKELNKIIQKMKEECENMQKEKSNKNIENQVIQGEEETIVFKGNREDKQREELDKLSYSNKDNLELQQAQECQQRLQEELTDLLRQKEQLKGKLEQQLAEIVRITQELADKTEENRKLSQQIQVQEIQIIEKEKMIDEKEESFQEIIVKCKSMEEDLARTQQESQKNSYGVQGYLDEIQQKNDELSRKYQDLLERFNLQNGEYKENKMKESERYNEVVKENIKLKEENSKMDNSLKQEISVSQQRIQDQLKELESKYQESITKNEEQKGQLSRLEEEKNKLQEEHNELKERYANTEEEVRLLKEKYLEEKELENDQLMKTKVVEKQDEQRKLQELQSGFEDRIKELQGDQKQQIEDLGNQHKRALEERLQQVNQEYSCQLEDKDKIIEEKQMEIEGLQEQIGKIKEESDKKDFDEKEQTTLLVQKMRSELIEEKEREMGQLVEQIKSKEQEMVQIGREFEALKEEQKEKETQNVEFIESLQTKLREEQEACGVQISELKQQLSQELLKQQDQYEERIQQDDTLNQKKMEEINAELQESIRKSNYLEEQLKEQDTQHEEDLKKATEMVQNAEIERLLSQIEDINKQMEEKDNECRDLQIVLGDLQNQLKDKKEELEKCHEEAQKIISQNQAVIMDEFERADWQNRVQQLNEQIGDLNKEISSSAVRMDELLAESAMNQRQAEQEVISYQNNMNSLKEQNNLLQQQIAGLNQQLNDRIATQSQTQFDQNNLRSYTKETTMQTDMLQTKQAVNSPSHEEFKKLLTKTVSLIDQKHLGLSQNIRRILRSNSAGFPHGFNNRVQKFNQDSITLNIQLVNPRREKRALNIIRKELEALYKTYVTLAFNLKLPVDSPYSQEFLHFEKKINRINQKVQECIDYIDEQAEKETRSQKTTTTAASSNKAK